MAQDHRISPGVPEPMGVTPVGDGINVAVFSARATRIELCLFDADDREVARLALPERTGDVWHGHVGGIRSGQRYGLRAHGPFAPRDGHRFNAHKLLLDPHSALIDRPFTLHPSMFAHVPGHPDADLSFDSSDSAPFMPKAIVTSPLPALSPGPISPWDRTVLYELHVRGFTKLHRGVPEAVRGRFAGLVETAPLAHLARLGVTAVELMPVAAWLDERHLPPLGLSNYWGYNPVLFGAPDPRLAPGGWAEMREAVGGLAGRGIETILDVVLNHSGEGDELGPTVSLRGLDNASYYRLDPHNPRLYANDAGCGNTLALERPCGLRLAMDSLRRFATQAGVHGFRFDLAATLGRRATGFEPDHPLLVAIAQDPVLSRLKLIAEPWDIGLGGYQLGNFPAGWGEWNDRYRDTARRFWRGDSGLMGEMATRFAGSADVFAARSRPLSRSINYITAHDGLTIADLVSHSGKHNLRNGEDNRDGTDTNHSWNNGVEGGTADPAIIAARRRDVRALLGTLLLSRGTPMLSMGDELGRSQGGNNNAYAQDNAVSWLDWDQADEELISHTARLIATRLGNAALRSDKALTGKPLDPGGLPDVDWLRADGSPMQPAEWTNPEQRLLVAALTSGPDRALVILNAGRDVMVAIPDARPGQRWHDLDGHDPDDGQLAVAERSVRCLIERPGQPARRRTGVDPHVLADLSRAAGIEPEWWDVSGRRTIVTPDVQAALLASLRLPATTTSDARESLHRVRIEQTGRALPIVLLGKAGQAIHLDLSAANGRRTRLLITGPGGDVRTIDVGPDDGEPGPGPQRRTVTLPPLAMGRHVLIEDGMPEAPCHLIVAPTACWTPPALAGRRFGLAAHLYALRRDGDQGIGDFTTLGTFGMAAQQAGAVTLGLNPLHALFGNDRERASPYHPSDRRFLDPIYLDATALPFADAPDVKALLSRHGRLFAELQRTASVDYTAVWQAKQEVLAAAFRAFEAIQDAGPTTLQHSFAAFETAGGELLERFACFETIQAGRSGQNWQSWPAPLRRGDASALAEVAAANRGAVRFVKFQQWLADRALGEAAASSGLELGFYRDLAVGAAPDGAEAWACQEVLALGMSIGAPPDPFAADGQVWNLPAPDPLAIRREGYASQGRLLQANMAHAGALRIDHAMGLARLFLVPDGASARDGAYVRYNLSEQLALLALESRQARCLVIGEDLGTVPEGFREAMTEAAILSYRVLWLEREGEAFRKPESYPIAATACVGTHDLPTLAGWLSRSDIDEVARLGLADSASAEAARIARDGEIDALRMAMAAAGLAWPDEMSEAAVDQIAALVHAFLARAPSALLLVQADDLSGDTSRINLPGTDRERANWRRKLAVDASRLLGTPRAAAILAALAGRMPQVG